MKKTPGDIIILHKCTKNHYHMLYCSWDVVYDRCNCHFSFWAIFLHFYPPNSPKNQNFEKMKKKNPGAIIIFYMCTKNYNQMINSFRDMVQTDQWKKWHIEVGAPPKNREKHKGICQHSPTTRPKTPPTKKTV